MKRKKKAGKSRTGKPKTIKGVIKVTAKPMGFVISEGLEDDAVVFEEGLNCALDKDELEPEIIGTDRGRKKVRVVKIINRNKTKFVGTIEKSGHKTIFRPDDFKFYRPVDLLDIPKDLETGTKALVEISWTNRNLNPRGKIISVIGKKGVHETEMQSILLDKGIIYDFPAEVEREANKIAEEYRNISFRSQNASHNSLQDSFWDYQRRDFRKALTFTIDPADAKDFDDAISYEILGNDKIRIGVHIADVSHFVRPDSALDREARKRSFSTYLVDRTIPMLPEVLSNDLCSLVPGKDRFAFSAVFDIENNTGKILDRWFGKTIINSDKRFSYEEAQKLLELRDASNESRVGGVEYSKPLLELNRIAKIYRIENKINGAIEFETDEVRFELDSEGKPLSIYKKARLDTMKMIEEWMLLANREVAKFISDKLGKKGGASIFRIHALPKMEKIEELAIFVRALGHELPITKSGVSAKDINNLLKQIQGHASESLIKTAAIRSMAKAEYSTKNIGHFGLAFEYYTHFTSPIRRYPDLMVHRILNKHLKNEALPKNELAKFEKIANEASEKEILIAEAERDSIKYKQVEFMQDKIGQEFDAVVSGVTEWGLYVEDPETKSEGMVRIKDMEGDYYKLDQKNYCIVGERTKKKLSLGDSIRVRLISADLDRKTLEFKLIQ
jgi:ribonuclease R